MSTGLCGTSGSRSIRWALTSVRAGSSQRRSWARVCTLSRGEENELIRSSTAFAGRLRYVVSRELRRGSPCERFNSSSWVGVPIRSMSDSGRRAPGSRAERGGEPELVLGAADRRRVASSGTGGSRRRGGCVRAVLRRRRTPRSAQSTLIPVIRQLGL